MNDLKLIALDAEDLRVLSCHLQDAVIRVEDMAYIKDEMRFAALASRFDWECAESAAGEYQRRLVRQRDGFELLLVETGKKGRRHA